MKAVKAIVEKISGVFRKSDAIEYVKKRNIPDYLSWVENEAARLDEGDETKNKYLRKLRKEAFPIKLFLEKNPALPIQQITLSYQNESWDAKCALKPNGHQNAFSFIEVTGTRGYNGDNVHLKMYREPNLTASDKDNPLHDTQIIKDRIYKKIQNPHYDENYLLLVYCEVMHSTQAQFNTLIQILNQDNDFAALTQKSVFYSIHVIQWDGQHAYCAQIK